MAIIDSLHLGKMHLIKTPVAGQISHGTVIITGCFCKKSLMAGGKKIRPVNFISSTAIGRCGKKLVLGPGCKHAFVVIYEIKVQVQSIQIFYFFFRPSRKKKKNMFKKCWALVLIQVCMQPKWFVYCQITSGLFFLSIKSKNRCSIKKNMLKNAQYSCWA